MERVLFWSSIVLFFIIKYPKLYTIKKKFPARFKSFSVGDMSFKLVAAMIPWSNVRWCACVRLKRATYTRKTVQPLYNSYINGKETNELVCLLLQFKFLMNVQVPYNYWILWSSLVGNCQRLYMALKIYLTWRSSD